MGHFPSFMDLTTSVGNVDNSCSFQQMLSSSSPCCKVKFDMTVSHLKLYDNFQSIVYYFQVLETGFDNKEQLSSLNNSASFIFSTKKKLKRSYFIFISKVQNLSKLTILVIFCYSQGVGICI